jgi:AraC-like DNA-binding protein
VIVEQDGREASLDAGDFAFVDPARPVRYASTPSTHVSVLFPRAMLPLRAQDAALLTAVRVSGDQGTGALVSTLARELPRHLDEYDAAEAARLGTTVVDLLGTALAARLDQTGALPSAARDRVLLQHVYAFIDAHLGDPGLSPAQVAAAHHVSLRYVHKVFETQSSSVAAWIRQRRLERCRQDLLDPAQPERPVAAIAARWGLPNAAHFSRVFRAAYGTPPAAYRAAAREP